MRSCRNLAQDGRPGTCAEDHPSCSSTSRPTGPWIHGCSHARLVQLGSLFRFFNHRSLPCSSDGICDYYPRICVIDSPGFLLDPPAVYPAFYGGKCGWRSGPECAGSAVPGLSADSAVLPVPAKMQWTIVRSAVKKQRDNLLNRQSRPLDAPSC